MNFRMIFMYHSYASDGRAVVGLFTQGGTGTKPLQASVIPINPHKGDLEHVNMRHIVEDCCKVFTSVEAIHTNTHAHGETVSMRHIVEGCCKIFSMY